jgi:putative membrane protein
VDVAVEDTKDAARRTRLANERTYLAWWRTGLTAIAVSLGAGKVVPGLTHTSQRPYELLGAGFALLGVLCIAHGYQRERSIDRALERGQFAPIDKRYNLMLTGLGALLSVATLVLILFVH